MSFRISPKAHSDLRQIGDKIAFDDPAAAEALIQRFLKRWRLLAAHPLSGRVRDDLGPGFRQVLTEPYVSLYQIEDDAVVIVRVIHTRRQIGRRDVGD